MRLIRAALTLAAGLLAATTSYLLAILAAAARVRPFAGRVESVGAARFLILMPAHDEEAGIGATLAAVRRLEYPAERVETAVIADNCSDRTGELARAAGATVLERVEPALRGRGHALAWALARLLPERGDVDAVVFLDADCEPHSRPAARAVEARLRGGARAVRVDYRVSNPGASWGAGLRYAAFALVSTVRPTGKEALGLSAGLLGTGMAFTRRLLEEHPWEAYSLAEDGEYHMRLVAAGERVAFAPEAAVLSAMPTSLGAARQQQLRWEGGRWELIRAWTPRLVRQGLARRDPVRLHAGLEPLVPPQSFALAAILGLGVLSVGTRSWTATKLIVATLLGQVTYVLGGLLLVRAPLHVYRALALAPVLMLWKLGVYARVLSGRGPTRWVRTDR